MRASFTVTGGTVEELQSAATKVLDAFGGGTWLVDIDATPRVETQEGVLLWEGFCQADNGKLTIREFV